MFSQAQKLTFAKPMLCNGLINEHQIFTNLLCFTDGFDFAFRVLDLFL